MLRFPLAMAVAIALLAGQVQGAPFSFSAWDGALKEHVKPGRKDGVKLNLVDYENLGKDNRFRETLKRLALYSPDFTSAKERIAFWVNVYNIFAVKVVVENHIADSIKDAGGLFRSVWKIDAGAVGGREYSLDEIEHGILRTLGDPRIHGAIVCASVSCPDLRAEAYLAEKLDEQLDDQMRGFLANGRKGLNLDVTNGVIRVSSIFKWFAEDFEKDGGVRPFIAGYMSKPLANFILDKNNEIEYMPYNWGLNGK